VNAARADLNIHAFAPRCLNAVQDVINKGEDIMTNLVTDSEVRRWAPDVFESKLFSAEIVARLLLTRNALIEALERVAIEPDESCPAEEALSDCQYIARHILAIIQDIGSEE
jgi:hypothetical protein